MNHHQKLDIGYRVERPIQSRSIAYEMEIDIKIPASDIFSQFCYFNELCLEVNI